MHWWWSWSTLKMFDYLIIVQNYDYEWITKHWHTRVILIIRCSVHSFIVNDVKTFDWTEQESTTNWSKNQIDIKKQHMNYSLTTSVSYSFALISIPNHCKRIQQFNTSFFISAASWLRTKIIFFFYGFLEPNTPIPATGPLLYMNILYNKRHIENIVDIVITMGIKL